MIRGACGLRGGREYLTGDERDEVETEESLARAASLASRRSFSFRARWTSSSILGSERRKLAHVLNHREHISPSCAVGQGDAKVRIREESASTIDAHKSYSSENTPGSSSSKDDDSTFAEFHRPLSYLSGLVVSEVVSILRTVCACLWAWGRPDNALGTWADLTLLLPSVRCSPEVPISNPAEGRLIGGGGPRPMDECSPKLSGSEGMSVGGKEMRACRLLALGEDSVGTAIALTLRGGVRWRLRAIASACTQSAQSAHSHGTNIETVLSRHVNVCRGCPSVLVQHSTVLYSLSHGIVATSTSSAACVGMAPYSVQRCRPGAIDHCPLDPYRRCRLPQEALCPARADSVRYSTQTEKDGFWYSRRRWYGQYEYDAYANSVTSPLFFLSVSLPLFYP